MRAKYVTSEKGREATRLAIAAKAAIEAHGSSSDEARAALSDLYGHVRTIISLAAGRCDPELQRNEEHDLRQYAAMRLPVYVQRYDPSRCQFITMIAGHVYRECQRELRRLRQPIRIPQHVHDAVRGYNDRSHSMNHADDAKKCMRVDSGESLMFAWNTKSEDDPGRISWRTLNRLNQLDARTREILSRRFGIDHGQQTVPEIARDLGISTQTVNGQVRSGLVKLRKSLQGGATC